MDNVENKTLAVLFDGLNEDDRSRLRLAWERHAKGDPDSLPSLYALADRFSIHAHAELLRHQEELLREFPKLIAQAKNETSVIREHSKSSRSPILFVAISCLLVGALGGFFATRNAPPDLDFVSTIQRSGAEISHYETISESGEAVHVVELATARKPRAYITQEGNAAIVYSKK